MTGENERLEFKKTPSEIKEAVISACAMLNKHGAGRVIFGIKDNSKAYGIKINSKIIRDISRAFSENIEPKIYPEVSADEVDKCDCVRVSFNGQDQPYFAYGRAYMRVGDEDRRLSAKELENMFLRRHEGARQWDSQLCHDADEKNVSHTKLRKALKNAGLGYGGVRNGLKKLNLLSGRGIKNAAIALFGSNPQSVFDNIILRCAVFASADTGTVIDMREFKGDILFLITKAEEYILRNINIGMSVEGLVRVEVPEIDREAVREAVVNAFCHRDYYLKGPVSIAVFKDRVEVRSPGRLVNGLTITQIKREMISERRNELIADIFHRMHLVERWGRGIKLMMNKEPGVKFKEIGNNFITVFKRKSVTTTITPTIITPHGT